MLSINLGHCTIRIEIAGTSPAMMPRVLPLVLDLSAQASSRTVVSRVDSRQLADAEIVLVLHRHDVLQIKANHEEATRGNA